MENTINDNTAPLLGRFSKYFIYITVFNACIKWYIEYRSICIYTNIVSKKLTGTQPYHPSTISNDFFPETTGLIVTKCHIQPPEPLGTKSCSNGLGHMTKMAVMTIYGKILKKSSSPKPIDQWPWNLVCSIVHTSTSKFVQIMTWVNLYLFYAMIKFGHRGLCSGKNENTYFLCHCEEGQGAVCFTPVCLSICLSVVLKTCLYNQLLLQFLSNWSETLHKCFRHIEVVHLPFWRVKNHFWQNYSFFGLWWCLFVLSFFPWGVLDILILIELVSEGFPSYFWISQFLANMLQRVCIINSFCSF